METDDHDLAAHACDIAEQRQRSLRAGRFEADIGAETTCQLFYNIRKRFLGDVYHARRTHFLCALQRVGTGIRDDDMPRSFQLDELLHQVAHEPGADEDDVIR